MNPTPTPEPSDGQTKAETPRTETFREEVFRKIREEKRFDWIDGIEAFADFARQLETELATVTAERDAALADAAVMREALTECYTYLIAVPQGVTWSAHLEVAMNQARTALETNPGASILAELAQLRELRKIDEHLGLEVCSLRDHNTKLLAIAEDLLDEANHRPYCLAWAKSSAPCSCHYGPILARLTELNGETK